MSNINTVRSIIESNGGKFVSISFVKKDGTYRLINGRLGVTKYLKGGVNKNPRLNNDQLVLWECKTKSYRTVNLNAVRDVSVGGDVYKIDVA